MDLFEYSQKSAESYYCSEEYQTNVSLLATILSGVRDQVIALDLEGVLVSRDIMENSNFDFLCKLGIIPANGLLHLQRPLSNKFLEILVKQRNQLLIWTAATLKGKEHITSSTGLKIPKQVGVICREDFSKLIQQNQNFQYYFKFFGKWINSLGKDQKTFYINYLEQLKQGIFKIPSILMGELNLRNLVLCDDNAERHKETCTNIGYTKDENRFIEVKPFTLDTEEKIREHHKDIGLIELAQDLAKHFSK